VGHWKTFYEKAALFCNKSQHFVDSFLTMDENVGHCTSHAAAVLEQLKRLSLDLKELHPTLGVHPHEASVPRGHPSRQNVQRTKQRWRY